MSVSVGTREAESGSGNVCLVLSVARGSRSEETLATQDRKGREPELQQQQQQRQLERKGREKGERRGGSGRQRKPSFILLTFKKGCRNQEK